MRFFIVLFTLFGTGVFSVSAQGIQFTEGTWAELKAKAKAEDKLIFMDAYTTWCGPCKWLAANVFTDDEVGAIMNENFINVKFDMEKGEGLEIAKTYAVRAYPTLLFIDGSGELVHRLCGAMPVAPFMEEIDQVLQRKDLLIDLEQAYQQQPDDKEVVARYLVALSKACASSGGKEEAFYASLSAEEMMEPYAFRVMQYFPPAVTSDAFLYLAENLEEYTSTFGAEAKDVITNAVMQHLRAALYQEDEDAYPAARAALREKGIPGTEEAILMMDLTYYQRTENWKAYVETATLYIDGFAADDPNTLNSVAWTIYEEVEDENAVRMGLEWASMAKEIEPSYAILDTYAALLFKSGQIEAGKEAAQIAIDTAKAEGTDFSDTEALIEKYVED